MDALMGKNKTLKNKEIEICYIRGNKVGWWGVSSATKRSDWK